MVALSISVMLVLAIVNGYAIVTKRAEWSCYCIAAQSLAQQRMEQTRAAKWDPASSPPGDELTAAKYPMKVDILDIPQSGTNIVYATNFTTISTIASNPPLRCIQVDCVWRFTSTQRLFTNTVVTYRSPDNQ